MAVAFNRNATDPAGVASSGGVTTYNNGGSGFSIGTAAINRWVYVAVSAEVASDPQSATIDYGAGAVAMTAFTLASFGNMRARWFKAHAPTGTTATIAITWSAAVAATENHISIYAVTGHDPTKDVGGTDTSTDMDASDPLTTGSITIASNGGFLGVAACATDTVGKTWANATEDLDVDAGGFRHTTATRTTSGTVTVTVTGGTNNEDGALAWVILKPGAAVVASAGSFSFSGSTTTLNFKIGAGAGAYSFTGSNATLALQGNPVLVPDAGSFSYAGENSLSDFGTNAGAGAFTFTGSNVTLTITDPNISLSVDAGAFTFTGSDATLRRYTLSASSGAFSFTGQDSKSDIGLNAEAGAFTFTGSVATLTQARKVLAADSGSFSFSGSTADLVISSGALRFIVDSGAFLFTGQSIATPYQHLVPDAGSFSFTGEDSHSDFGVTAGSGSFSFTGSDAQITSSSGETFIAADAGSFTWTGADSLRGLVLVLASGTFTFTGSDTSPKFAHKLSAGATAFSFAGSSATLIEAAGRTLFADAGSFSFSGSDVGLSTSTQRRIVADAGSFSFSGEDSHSDFGLTAGSGSFSFTGQNATLAAGPRFVVDSGNWAFAGSAQVNTLHGWKVLASSGSFSFTGSAATLRAPGGRAEVWWPIERNKPRPKVGRAAAYDAMDTDEERAARFSRMVAELESASTKTQIRKIARKAIELPNNKEFLAALKRAGQSKTDIAAEKLVALQIAYQIEQAILLEIQNQNALAVILMAELS